MEVGMKKLDIKKQDDRVLIPLSDLDEEYVSPTILISPNSKFQIEQPNNQNTTNLGYR